MAKYRVLNITYSRPIFESVGDNLPKSLNYMSKRPLSTAQVKTAVRQYIMEKYGEKMVDCKVMLTEALFDNSPEEIKCLESLFKSDFKNLSQSVKLLKEAFKAESVSSQTFAAIKDVLANAKSIYAMYDAFLHSPEDWEGFKAQAKVVQGK